MSLGGFARARDFLKEHDTLQCQKVRNFYVIKEGVLDVSTNS